MLCSPIAGLFGIQGNVVLAMDHRAHATLSRVVDSNPLCRVDQAKVLAAKGLDKSRKFITDTLAPATGDAIVTVAAAADVLVHKAAREIDRLIAEHGPEDVKKLIGDLRGRLSEVTGRRPPPGQVPPTTDKKSAFRAR